MKYKEYRKTVPYLHYQIILNYLYLLNNEIIQEEFLWVTDLIEYQSNNNGIFRPARFYFNEVNKMYFTDTDNICGIIKYFNEEYVFTAGIIHDIFEGECESKIPVCSIVSKKGSYDSGDYILNFILEESIKRSYIKKAAYCITSKNILSLEGIEQLDLTSLPSDEIYLPDYPRKQIMRFKKAIVQNGRALRFLFYGKAGSGKSQIINMILKYVNKKLLILKILNLEIEFNDIKRFLSFFDRSLLVLDNVDMFFKDGNIKFSNDKLFKFLQFIDSMSHKNIFILASTNDKEFVDTVVARPGRFDMIINLDNIELHNYLELVKKETDIPEIINCFDNNMLKMMEEKKSYWCICHKFDKTIKTRVYS